MSFAWAKPYEPKTELGRWFDERMPLPRLVYNAVGGGYPVPRNLNYGWNFGVPQRDLPDHPDHHRYRAGDVVLVRRRRVQFGRAHHARRELGWMMRYAHSNGAAFFFIVVYIHIFRGLYYGSYKAPRELVWMLGLVIYLDDGDRLHGLCASLGADELLGSAGHHGILLCNSAGRRADPRVAAGWLRT